MDITYLIAHPEELDQETLYDLRRLVAVYPTYHAARILFLQNLFLLHDPTFDQELRRAALLVPDRRVLFALTQTIAQPKRTVAKVVETMTTAEETDTIAAPTAAAESAKGQSEATAQNAEAATLSSAAATISTNAETVPMQDEAPATAIKGKRNAKKYATGDTTSMLLDNFLDSTPRPLAKKRIKADPSSDYMSYLMQMEEEEIRNSGDVNLVPETSRLDSLINSFIENAEGGITLSEDPMMPEDLTYEQATTETTGIEEIAETATQPVEPAEGATEAIAESAEDAAETLAETTESTAEATESATESNHDDDSDTTVVTSSAELSETLAQIYIKQHRYDRAIEVLSKINTEDTAKTNPYLADQMRFLQKLSKLSGSKNK